MSYIYKITNQINGKVYVGKTNLNINERFRQHCNDSKKDKFNDRPLYVAMNKYGVDNFKLELIEECSNEIGDEREKFWIEYIGSFKDGYNATKGGLGKQYLDYELIYRTYIEVKSIERTSEIVDCSRDAVANVIKLYGVTKNEILNNVNKPKCKMVAMLNNKGVVVKTFSSTHDAGKYFNKTHQHIQEVCRGKRKTAYGYSWKYI